jgi:hypothetical protein
VVFLINTSNKNLHELKNEATSRKISEKVLFEVINEYKKEFVDSPQNLVDLIRVLE